jgi:2-dehydro-3-deoxygluconokinase
VADLGISLDIVALGEPLIEFNQTQARSPHAYVQGYGGDTSNMAIAAARLGARVGYVTRVGDDAFGRLFRDLWAAEGVDARGVATDPTASMGTNSPTCARDRRQAACGPIRCRSS